MDGNSNICNSMACLRRAGWTAAGALLFGTCLLVTGCSRSASESPTSNPSSYPYAVTTSVGMVTDIVRQVAGEHAEVTGMIGEGVDPHTYQPTRRDLGLLHQADIVFYAGLRLEGKMQDTLEKISKSGKSPVHPVTRLIDESYLLPLADYPGHYDPHVWMDASAWAQCVQAVAQALAEFDPAHAQSYQSRAEAFMAQCEALHAYGKKSIATIPEGRRVLITSHDAFSYFGRAYGMEVRGIQGISTESEAGLHDINTLVDFLVDRKISAVFVETSVSRKNIEALIEGAAAKGHEVRVGGELFSDAMGEPGTYEGTYIGMLDHNITLVTRALGGEAPPQGLHGKLTRIAEQSE